MIGILNSKIIIKIKNIKGNYLVALLKWILITVLLSLVISISLFTLIVHYFQVIPLYGMLTNLIITPLFSIIIMPFLFLDLILPAPLCVFFFKISDISISFMLKVVSFVSSLNSSTIWFPQFSHNLVIIYVILFLFFIATVSKVKYLFLGLCVPVFICIFVNPLPNFIIDKNMKLLAFLDLNTKKYVLTSLQQARTIKNTWFKYSSKIHEKNIINSKIFYFIIMKL